MSCAIYSTFCGTDGNAACVLFSYTHLPCYMFSNNPDFLAKAAEKGWIPIFLVHFFPPSPDPIVSATQAKFAKARPDLLTDLARYDYLWYVDTKVFLDEDKMPALLSAFIESGAPIAARRHWYLDPTVIAEFHEAMTQERYRKQEHMIRDYIARRLQTPAFKEKEALYATGILLRNMRHPDATRINVMWEAEIQQCGIQCQISFFFVAQTVSMFTLPFSLDKQNVNNVLERVEILETLPVCRPLSNHVNHRIPRILHMFWMHPTPMAPRVFRHFTAWQRLMPHWQFKLWLDGDESEFGTEVMQRIAQTESVFERNEIVRAFVLQKYGGVAMLERVEPLRSLEPIIHMNKNVVLCHWRVFNSTYMQTDMIAVAPHMPLIDKLCEIVLASTPNAVDCECTTGAVATGLAIETCAIQDELYVVLPPSALYRTDPNAFGHVNVHDPRPIDLNHEIREYLVPSNK